MTAVNSTFPFAVSAQWYREAPVKVAFTLSVLAHATAILLLPGLRVQSPETPAALVVELVAEAPPETITPVAPPQPVREPAPVLKRKPMPIPESQPRPAPPPALVRPETILTAPPEPAREPTVEAARPLPQPVEPAPPPQAKVEPIPERLPAETKVTAKAEVPAPPLRLQAPPVDAAALKAFGEVLAQAIAKRKDYPRLARMRSWQGTTELTLQIGADGNLLDVRVGHSSGFQVLDAAAIQMVHNAAPLPDVPASLRGRELTMTVPVVFRLEAL